VGAYPVGGGWLNNRGILGNSFSRGHENGGSVIKFYFTTAIFNGKNEVKTAVKKVNQGFKIWRNSHKNELLTHFYKVKAPKTYTYTTTSPSRPHKSKKAIQTQTERHKVGAKSAFYPFSPLAIASGTENYFC
jgi:hypothetical protein